MNKLLVAVCFGAASAAIAQTAPPPDPPKRIVVTVHLCAANIDTPECTARLQKWQYLKDLRDLIALQIEEFEKTGKDWVDLDLRKHIDALEKRIQKERP